LVCSQFEAYARGRIKTKEYLIFGQKIKNIVEKIKISSNANKIGLLLLVIIINYCVRKLKIINTF